MGGCYTKILQTLWPQRTEQPLFRQRTHREPPQESYQVIHRTKGFTNKRSTLSANPRQSVVHSSTRQSNLRESDVQKRPLVSINTANYHELCVIEQISVEQAKGIVNYRTLHGPFHHKDQLLRVPGITQRKLEIIWPRISLEGLVNKIGRSQSTPRKRQPSSPKDVSLLHSPGKIFSPSFLRFGEQASPPNAKKTQKGDKTIKIATWNMHCFSTEKVGNKGVLEVVCLTLLMHGFDLVVFQELSDGAALIKVCEELNCPTLPKVQSWPSRRAKWKYLVSDATGRMFQGLEYQGFLWNESLGIRNISSGLLGKSNQDNEQFVRRPFIGSFSVGCWNFLLVSVHLRAVGWSGKHLSQVKAEVELLSPLVQALSATTSGKVDIIVLGDFNLGPDDTSFLSLKHLNYVPVLPAGIPTNISPVNPNGSSSYDNIWISTSAEITRYSGRCGVIRRSLTVPDFYPVDISLSDRATIACTEGICSKHISVDHKDLIHDVSYDFYGKRMATCSSDQSVKVFDLRDDGQWHCTGTWKCHYGSVWKVSWAHPEFGQVLATCSFDRTVAIWEEQVADKKASPMLSSETHWVKRASLVDSRTEVNDVKFAPRHMGLQLATCSTDGQLRIYEAPDVMNLSQWSLLFQLSCKPGTSCLSWNPSRIHPPMIVVGTDDTGSMASSRLQIFEYSEEARKWQKIHSIVGVVFDPVHDVAFAPNLGRSYHMLAVASKDVDIIHLAPSGTDTHGSTKLDVRHPAHFDHQGAQVWRVDWNVTGTILASSGDDGCVRLWKANYLENWKCISVLKADGGSGNPVPPHLTGNHMSLGQAGNSSSYLKDKPSNWMKELGDL